MVRLRYIPRSGHNLDYYEIDCSMGRTLISPQELRELADQVNGEVVNRLVTKGLGFFKITSEVGDGNPDPQGS